MLRKYYRVEKGFTLIELVIVLAILSIVTVTIFRVFFFGLGTYASGKMQYDIQSDIRFASDVIRDRVRYVSDLDVLPMDVLNPFFDPSSADINFKYIYLADDKKSIKFKDGNQSPIDIINSNSNDVLFELEFITGSNSSNVIRFSNSIVGGTSTDEVLKYNILGESLLENKKYKVETEIDLLNLNSQLPDLTYVEGPIASPEEGAVPYGTNVSLTTTEVGLSIYYTTDGNNPNTSSNKYESPIIITAGTTIKAIAVKDGNSSSIAIYEYSISSAPPPSASGVNIAGGDDVGSVLTVTYTYSSAAEPQLPQGGSTIRWYRAAEKIGNPHHTKTLIKTDTFIETNTSTRQYTLVNADSGNYIYVEIIPRDNTGTLGLSEWSSGDFGKIKN